MEKQTTITPIGKNASVKNDIDLQTRGEEAQKKAHEIYLRGLEEEIKSRARTIYLARTGEPCSPLTDWHQAEEEITEKHGISSNNKQVA